MKKITSIILLSLLLTGCARPYNLSRFVGMSKDQLYSCAGPPTSSRETDGAEYLSYSSQATRGSGGYTDTHSCRLNFTIRNNQVAQVNGNWYGPRFNKATMCKRMFRQCR